jgi:hypothetical protein
MLASREVALAFGHHEDRTPTHGYEERREEAMAAFAKAGGGSEGMSAFGHPGNAADRWAHPACSE